MKKIAMLGAAMALGAATVAQANEGVTPAVDLVEPEFVMSTQDMAGDMSGGGGEMIIPLIIVAILAIAATEGSGFCLCD